MELKPFDPADYLDSEEGIAAYLEDARLDGDAASSRALDVVARARARMGEAAGRLARNARAPGARAG